MAKRSEGKRPLMGFKVMDCRSLTYPDETFDIVIDKSTIDALLCGSNAFFNVAIMLKECQRVLKTGGYYVAISYGQPNNREFHFQRKHLNFSLKTFELKRVAKDGSISLHFIYICRKEEGAVQKMASNFMNVMSEIRAEMDEEKSSDS